MPPLFYLRVRSFLLLQVMPWQHQVVVALVALVSLLHVHVLPLLLHLESPTGREYESEQVQLLA